MVYNISNVVWMGVLTLVMVRRARYSVARRMTAIPLMMTVMEVLFCNTLSAAFPILSVALFAARTAVTLCCAGQLRKEAAVTKRRMRLRRLARESENIGLVIPMPQRNQLSQTETLSYLRKIV